MKAPEEIIHDHLVIKEGYFKGARITFTTTDIIEMMIEYHKQFEDGSGNI
jgi:hypothetical protein